jgi:hypothetical protein
MKVCVFSSSSNAINECYFNEAKILGSLIAEHGHTLVNGGANVGLMEATTISAKNRGAKTIGIIPEKMQERSLVSDHSHEVIITSDMQERKAKMREISDAFIALPGGFGTLEEILEIMTLKQLTYHNKAIVFVNTNNFFDHLFKQFELSYNEHFAKEDYKDIYFVAENSESAITYINNYKPLPKFSKWFKVPEKKQL